jgi:hypothetical protein
MWQTVSIILNIILAVLSVYFYCVLKGLKVEKSLATKMAELKKLKNDYSLCMPGTAGYYREISNSDYEKEQNEYIYRISCVGAEIKELEKILKRFYFIKWFIQ